MINKILNEIDWEIENTKGSDNYYAIETLKQLKTRIEFIIKGGQVQAQVIRACDKCDDCGTKKTYENQACMPLNGKVVCIDWCIHQIVAALNAGGIETIACCCGHNKQKGRIDLVDGRILWIEKPV